MNENTCMVDTARYFLDFIRDESCGKCLPCRVGTKRMLEILERITEGKGKDGDIEMLEELAQTLKDTAMCGLGQTAANPVLSTIRYFREEYETHIFDHHCTAGACVELQSSPCRNACPAGVQVPGYLALVSAGRLTDAYRLIRQDNPFPAVCGRICTHPCESYCRRAQIDEAVAICSVKRFVGDYALQDGYGIPLENPLQPTGKRVAIVGSGPSGLTCGYYLSQLGHKVDVFEAESVAGGVLCWGIPEFRLPKEILAKEIHAIEKSGVAIRLNQRIGKDLPFEQLTQAYDAVYIAVGTQKSRNMDIPGEALPGVESGLEFLQRIGLGKDTSVPSRLAVVGGGSTAMDVARTALRLGSRQVTVLYRRTKNEISASKLEIEEAIEEGAIIMTLAAPLEILETGGVVSGVRCIRHMLTDYGKDGRRKTRVIEGSEFIIECDGVVAAINQDVDSEFHTTIEVDITASGSIDINKYTTQTNKQGVFAGGDASAWGTNVVISAIADGKRAAANIDKYLGGEGLLYKGAQIDIPEIEDDTVTEPHMRFPTRKLDPEHRRNSFAEVEKGFHKLDAMAETLRCLHCDRR